MPNAEKWDRGQNLDQDRSQDTNDPGSFLLFVFDLQ